MVLFFNCKEEKNSPLIDLAYTNTLSQTIKMRSEGRIKYLELTGLFKLDSTSNTFGSAASNDFILTIENLTPTIDVLIYQKMHLLFMPKKT